MVNTTFCTALNIFFIDNFEYVFACWKCLVSSGFQITYGVKRNTNFA